MFTVELRFKEDGKELSFDWFTDQFATQLAGILKEQLAAERARISSAGNEPVLEGFGPHIERERRRPKAVGINEAAQLLGIRPSTLRVQVKQGRIRVVRFGRRVLIPMESIERVLQEGMPSRI